MTNREAHEKAAGMGLDDMFFKMNGIDPDDECQEDKVTVDIKLNDEINKFKI